MDLSEIQKLMTALKDPWKHYPCVLIAGTNGKGSVTAFLSQILAEAGYRVGIYTSPHLSFYKERIQVLDLHNPFVFSEESWWRNLRKIEQAILKHDLALTQFELLTALAFLIFHEEKIDTAVLEVGMGGRLDATNIVEPVLSIVTDISYDHQEYLGNTLQKIAKEKAGIFRNRIPCVVLNQAQEVMETFEKQAKSCGSFLQIVNPGELLSFSPSGQVFQYQGKTYHSKLIGTHQVRNSSIAIEAARILRDRGFKIADDRIEAGIQNALWPARFEVFEAKQYIIIDGAHNPGGASVLAQTLMDLKFPEPHLLIIGVLEGKDMEGIFHALEPWGETWIFCQSYSPRAVQSETLYYLAQTMFSKKKLILKNRVGEAIRSALSKSEQKGTICITGSLTTAGEARRILKRILP
jgi:dihydrofolate synthase/folylpolyglutamate synthase